MPDDLGVLLMWASALLIGGVLGIVFFAGLWWTVRWGAALPSSAHWFLVSLILRSAIVLIGFYVVGAGQPVQMGLCLLGFWLARTLVLLATKPAPAAASPTSGSPPCA